MCRQPDMVAKIVGLLALVGVSRFAATSSDDNVPKLMTPIKVSDFHQIGAAWCRSIRKPNFVDRQRLTSEWAVYRCANRPGLTCFS